MTENIHWVCKFCGVTVTETPQNKVDTIIANGIKYVVCKECAKKLDALFADDNEEETPDDR